jgi:methoxymalonate biosynthesis acyl carrier protein
MQKNAGNEGPMQLTREIAQLINDQLLVEVGSPDDDLLASGVLDSLTLVQLLFDLERRFGVTIPLEELEIDDFRSINSIASLVQARSSASEGLKSGQGKTRAAFAEPALGRNASSS